MMMRFKMSADAPDGTILLFGVRYTGMQPSKTFTYVLLKAGGFWYATGGTGRVPTCAGWIAVQRWLDADGREVMWVKAVTETVDVWPEPAEPASAPQRFEQ
jgi:hypothetical protein